MYSVSQVILESQERSPKGGIRNGSASKVFVKPLVRGRFPAGVVGLLVEGAVAQHRVESV